MRGKISHPIPNNEWNIAFPDSTGTLQNRNVRWHSTKYSSEILLADSLSNGTYASDKRATSPKTYTEW